VEREGELVGVLAEVAEVVLLLLLFTLLLLLILSVDEPGAAPPTGYPR